MVIEADIAFDDNAMNVITEVSGTVWFTCGSYQPHQVGGILCADEHGWLKDLRYTAAYQEAFLAYKKLIGVVYVGPDQMPVFSSLLRTAANQRTPQ